MQPAKTADPLEAAHRRFNSALDQYNRALDQSENIGRGTPEARRIMRNAEMVLNEATRNYRELLILKRPGR